MTALPAPPTTPLTPSQGLRAPPEHTPSTQLHSVHRVWQPQMQRSASQPPQQVPTGPVPAMPQLCRDLRSCVAIHFFGNDDLREPGLKREDKRALRLGCPCHRGGRSAAGPLPYPFAKGEEPLKGAHRPRQNAGCCGVLQGGDQALVLSSAPGEEPREGETNFAGMWSPREQGPCAEPRGVRAEGGTKAVHQGHRAIAGSSECS